MNTPPQIKRYNPKFPTDGTRPPDGRGFGSIGDDAIAALVGRITAQFVHIEDMMGNVLAALARSDQNTAGYMLRAIKSPRGRVDLMRELLQKSPFNRERPREWDDVIGEFWRINGRRNAYVHGHWWTIESDNSCWLAEEDEHGMSFLVTRRIEVGELEGLLDEMGALLGSIITLTLAARRATETEPFPQSPAPTP